jgi:hypothetical protein
MSTLFDPKKITQNVLLSPAKSTKEMHKEMTQEKATLELVVDTEEEETLDDKALEEQVFDDYFLVETKYFDQTLIKSIVLPKFIMGQGSMGFREKGFVTIAFWGEHKEGSNAYKQALQSIKHGLGKFKIKFIDPETNEFLTTWEFIEPTIHAIDFGHVARMRSTPTEFIVEIDYTGLKIDDITI